MPIRVLDIATRTDSVNFPKQFASVDRPSMGNPISRELFLARALDRFGDRYDYSEIVYKSYKTPIRISCRQHPVRPIMITPEKHLQTTGGCKYCLREYRIRALERELNREAVERPQPQMPEPQMACPAEDGVS